MWKYQDVPLHKASTLLVLVFSIHTADVYADSWPAFTAPDAAYLINHGLVQTQDCPVGEGKLVSNLTIPVQTFCLSRWCPAGWMWVAKSDNACHDLKNGFNLQRYAATRHRGQDGMTDYSEVVAFYEGNNQFKFTTPREHWECFEFSDAIGNYVSCANDSMSSPDYAQRKPGFLSSK